MFGVLHLKFEEEEQETQATAATAGIRHSVCRRSRRISVPGWRSGCWIILKILLLLPPLHQPQPYLPKTRIRNSTGSKRRRIGIRVPRWRDWSRWRRGAVQKYRRSRFTNGNPLNSPSLLSICSKSSFDYDTQRTLKFETRAAWHKPYHFLPRKNRYYLPKMPLEATRLIIKNSEYMCNGDCQPTWAQSAVGCSEYGVPDNLLIRIRRIQLV